MFSFDELLDSVTFTEPKKVMTITTKIVITAIISGVAGFLLSHFLHKPADISAINRQLDSTKRLLDTARIQILIDTARIGQLQGNVADYIQLLNDADKNAAGLEKLRLQNQNQYFKQISEAKKEYEEAKKKLLGNILKEWPEIRIDTTF